MGDLKRLSITGGVVTFAAQAFKFILNLASTVMLARLLLPQDFGLVAMATTVTGFITIFKDLGLTMATVQQLEINHRQVSTLFWINVAISILLTLITLGIAPAVAWFYGEPRLNIVTAVLSCGFIIGGLSMQHQALLRRQMRLSILAAIEVIAMATGFLVGVVLASAKCGYWSLVAMQIANVAVNTLGIWFACRWRPGKPSRDSGIRAMLEFGGKLTGSGMINYVIRNCDSLLIGRSCGAQVLGLYSRAYSILLLPIGQFTAPMTSVAVPALSRLQNDPDRFKLFYLKAVKLIAYLSMPLVAVMGVLADELVLYALGEQWTEAGPIFRALAVAAYWSPVAATVGWVYVSLNRAKEMLQWTLIVAPVMLLVVWIGLHWGAIGVAMAYSSLVTLQVIPQFQFALRNSAISVMDILVTIRNPVLLSGVAALGAAAPKTWLPQGGLATLVICLIGAAMAATAMCLIRPSVKVDVEEARSMLKSFSLNKSGYCHEKAVPSP